MEVRLSLMLSSAYEASPRSRSLPMSSSQPPGSASASGLAPGLPPVAMSASVPAGSIVVGSQTATSLAVSAAPGSAVVKNGMASQGGGEEEVSPVVNYEKPN